MCWTAFATATSRAGIGLLALLLFATGARGQVPVAERPIDVEQTVAEALAGNADLAIALTEARATADQAGGASAFLWPVLQFETGLVRSTDPVFAFGSKLRQSRFAAADLQLEALNDPGPVEDWSTSVGLTWSALSPPSWMARSAAARGAEAAAWTSVRTRQATELQARTLYYEAVQAIAHVESATAAEAAAAATLERFERRRERGLLTEADRLQAEAEHAFARAGRLGAERQAREARTSLAVFLGWEPGVLPLPVDTLESPEPPPSEAFEPERRADLRALAAARAARESEVRRASFAYLPAVDAFGQVTAHSRDAFERDADDWTAGVRLRWTLFAGFARAADRGRAREALSAARLREDRARRAALAEVDVAERAVAAAAAGAEAAIAGRRAAEAATALMRRRFEEGLATPAELLDAEARQTSMRSGAIDALAAYQVALARAAFARNESDPEDLP